MTTEKERLEKERIELNDELDDLEEQINAILTVRDILYDRQEWNAYYPLMGILAEYDERFDDLNMRFIEVCAKLRVESE